MTRTPVIAGTVLIAVMAVLFCLIPKPENDLFFILRIGTDILHTGRLPHFDSYSWTNYGTHWDLPEWGAFVLYAHAFQAGGFWGAWLLMTLLTVAAALVVWLRLVRCAGVAWAFALTTLMLVASSGSIQERPYAFTYLLLAVGLGIVQEARETRLRRLLWLLPVSILWANLHQGVLVLVGLLFVYAVGDALSAIWGQGQYRRSGIMASAAVACTLATLVSPYGWHLYGNVYITLRDPTLMANVTEWNSVAVLPLVQLQPLVVLVLLVFGAIGLSRVPEPTPNPLPRGEGAFSVSWANLAPPFLGEGLGRGLFWGSLLAVAVLLSQALLHARNIPLFAVGSLMIASSYFRPATRQIRRQLGLSPEPEPNNWLHKALLGVFALLFVAAVALVSVTSLRKAVGPRGYSPAGIGEAVARVPTYPSRACAFMDAEGFPTDLRLLNDFETGGYLLWRRPRQRVFVDGRLDVYVGRTFDAMLTLTRSPGTPAWAELVKRYDFDCVLTTSSSEASAFAADLSQWQLVYTDPVDPARPHQKRCRILLRRRPQFAALIARCVRGENPSRLVPRHPPRSGEGKS